MSIKHYEMEFKGDGAISVSEIPELLFMLRLASALTAVQVDVLTTVLENPGRTWRQSGYSAIARECGRSRLAVKGAVDALRADGLLVCRKEDGGTSWSVSESWRRSAEMMLCR